jgi:hypothetical protein
MVVLNMILFLHGEKTPIITIFLHFRWLLVGCVPEQQVMLTRNNKIKEIFISDKKIKEINK